MASAPHPAGAPPKAGLFGTTLVVALVVVLAWQLAHWTWVFFAPASLPAQQAEARAVDLAAIAKLFGAASVSEAPAASGSGLRLKGVIAPNSGPMASAIFATSSGKEITVFVDHDVQQGVKLVEVRPDYVVISRAGARERIDLELPRGSVKSAVAARGAAAFKLNVAKSGANSYSLSRHELDDALRDPNQLSYLGQIGMPPGGGVRMDSAPSGSLAQKLGLLPGDVIKKVNGQSVASTGDLARLYQQFATTSLIQAEIQRGTATVQLTYAIQP